MATFVVPPSHSLLKPGVYKAILTGVEEKTGPNGAYLAWLFEVAGANGQVLKRPTSTNFGSQANARKFAEALLGRSLEVGESVESDDLVGRECQVIIEHATLPDGRTVARIASVLPLAGGVPF